MKSVLSITLSLLIGFASGWVSSRSKELAEFRRFIETAGISEEQLIETYKGLPAIMENMESDDRMATVTSLVALRLLEENKIEDTKRFLARQPASFFVIYGPPDNPKKKMTEERLSTLRAIEKAQENSPFLAKAIQDSLSNINKE
jgi:hypothetical protein